MSMNRLLRFPTCQKTLDSSSYLFTWSLSTSSCCFSAPVIISSTSVSCSGSAPLTCRDARMASIRWDLSRRRLENHHNRPAKKQEEQKPTVLNGGIKSSKISYLFSLDSNRRRSMRLPTVCRGKKCPETKCYKKPEKNLLITEGGSIFSGSPCNSSAAASGLLGAGWRCKGKRCEREHSRGFGGFPEGEMSRSDRTFGSF